jgi:hypothetical protein
LRAYSMKAVADEKHGNQCAGNREGAGSFRHNGK